MYCWFLLTATLKTFLCWAPLLNLATVQLWLPVLFLKDSYSSSHRLSLCKRSWWAPSCFCHPNFFLVQSLYSLLTYLFLRYFTFLPWEHLFKARLSSTLAFMPFPSTSALCCSPSVLILPNFSFCLHLSSTRNSFFYLRFLLFITITAGNQPLPPPLCSVEANRPRTPVKHGSTLFLTQHWQREAWGEDTLPLTEPEMPFETTRICLGLTHCHCKQRDLGQKPTWSQLCALL